MTSLALPPFIMTSDENSFARLTIASRKPLIIDQVLIDNNYPASLQEALLHFKDELVSGQIRLLEEETEDRPIWDHDIRPWLGKTWLEIPWYLAEAYFFRRVLEATGYFQPGPWQGYDPFNKLKEIEIKKALPFFTQSYLQAETHHSEESFKNALNNALWGNQVDLSNLDKEFSSHTRPHGNLLRDDTSDAYEYLMQKPAKTVYFFDNVGKELYFDLALLDHLLQHESVPAITCLLKNQPFFVSDVMEKDFLSALNQLLSSGENRIQDLGLRLQTALLEGSIQIETPPFLTTGRMYRQLPDDLITLLRDSDLTILKGEVNYRRLVGDRHWEPTTPIGRAAVYFPSTFLSLRTIKAEMILGLTQAQIGRLEREAAPGWMISGDWGLITFLKK